VRILVPPSLGQDLPQDPPRTVTPQARAAKRDKKSRPKPNPPTSSSSAGTLVRQVFDDGARDRLVGNVAGHLRNGVSEPVLQRAFEYWRNVDKQIGDRIADAVREGA